MRQPICQLFFARIRKHRLWSYCLQVCVVSSRESESDREYTMGYVIRLHTGVVRSAETALPITHLSGGVCTNTITLSLSRKQVRSLGKTPVRVGGEYPASAAIFHLSVLLNCKILDFIQVGFHFFPFRQWFPTKSILIKDILS